MSTCAQLNQQIQLLTNLIAHVHDPEAQWELIQRRNDLLAQWHARGCDQTFTRILAGQITIWTDNPELPSRSKDISLNLTILEDTGAISFTFDTVPIGKVKISLAPGKVGMGTLDRTAGSLFLNAPILMQNVPLAPGDVRFDLSLSTAQSIQPQGPTMIHGQPLPIGTDHGPVVLVGETDVTIIPLVLTVKLWVEISGTLELPTLEIPYQTLRSQAVVEG